MRLGELGVERGDSGVRLEVGGAVPFLVVFLVQIGLVKTTVIVIVVFVVVADEVDDVLMVRIGEDSLFVVSHHFFIVAFDFSEELQERLAVVLDLL